MSQSPEQAKKYMEARYWFQSNPELGMNSSDRETFYETGFDLSASINYFQI